MVEAVADLMVMAAVQAVVYFACLGLAGAVGVKEQVLGNLGVQLDSVDEMEHHESVE